MEIPKGDWGAQFRWSLSDAACQSALRRHGGAMAALRLTYDNDGLWDWGEPAEDGPRLLRGMVDQYADAGASALVWGCGNNLAWSYTPREQELWCDRVPTDEPGLRALAERQRAWLTAGTDPLAIVCARASEHGLPVLAGFRLNRFMERYGVESWYRANPHLMLSAESCPLHAHTRSANLARDEVKAHFVAHSLDVVARYPVDGLHLEFMRAVPFFEGNEPRKTEHMTAFLRMLRGELDRIGRERARPLTLSIWIGTPENYGIIRKGLFPPEFLNLAYLGMDPLVWATEGLVDILCLSAWSGGAGRRAHVFDIGPWAALARGSAMRVMATIDNAADLTDAAALRESEDTIRAYEAAANGVLLFNTQPYHLALIMEQAAPGAAMAPPSPER